MPSTSTPRPARSAARAPFQLQGEYYYRKRDIDRRDVYFACHPAGIDCDDPAAEWQIGDVRNEQSFSEKQDGYYLQALVRPGAALEHRRARSSRSA
jgi:hypothetical protein